MADRASMRTPFPEQVPRPTRGKSGRTASALTPVNIRATGVELDDATRDHVRRRMGRQLGKFVAHVERVSVRLRDTNGPRGGVDHACGIKVVLSGRPSVVVEERARTPRAAFDSAAARTERAVRRSLGRGSFGAAPTDLARPLSPEAEAGAGAGAKVKASKVKAPSTARRNLKQRTSGFTSALEDSAKERPSRKSTRGSANRAKRDTQLRQRQLRRKRAPKARARRSATKQPANLG